MKNERVTYQVFSSGVIKATIKDCRLDAINVLNDKFIAHSTSCLYVGANKFDDRYLMPYSFTAIAKCSPEDEFDVERGKQIALSRLSEKYEKSLNKRLARFMLNLDKSLQKMDEYFKTHTF